MRRVATDGTSFHSDNGIRYRGALLMARSYANVATAIWRDPDFLRLPGGAQRTYFLLITQEDISAAGTLPLTVRRWSRMCTDGDAGDVRADLATLAAARFVVYDEDTEELLVRSFVRWDGGHSNPKRRPVILRDAAAVISPAVRGALLAELERLGLPVEGIPGIHLDRVSDGLSDPGPPGPVDNPVDNLFPQVDSLSDSQPDTDASSNGVVVVTELPVVDPQPTTRNPQPATHPGAPRRDADQARDDVDRLCEHLADRIEANGCKRPVVTKGWRDAARLMLDRDGRTEEKITGAIDWATADEFWRANILSMPKLREQYDRLRLAATRARAPTNGSRNGIDWNAAMQRAQAAETREIP
jgi:hypothetical protein